MCHLRKNIEKNLQCKSDLDRRLDLDEAYTYTYTILLCTRKKTYKVYNKK